MLVLLMASSVAASAVPALPPEEPVYAESDPYYSDQMDAAVACIDRLSKTYRYDFDRPELTALRQAADAVRKECKTEIAALDAIVSPLEKTGAPDSVIAGLDGFLILPLIWAENRSPKPARAMLDETWIGRSELSGSSRITYLRGPSRFAGPEVLAVSRWDAEDKGVVKSFGDDFHHYAVLDGWQVEYRSSSGDWYGSARRGGLVARVSCNDGKSRWDRRPPGCKIEIGDRLLHVRGAGKPFQIAELCNPGYVYQGDVRRRPEVPTGAPRVKAREGWMTVDGGGRIRLPDGECARRDMKNVLAQLKPDSKIVASFIPTLDTRRVTAGGAAAPLEPAVKLAAHLFHLMTDPQAQAELKTTYLNLRARARPYTLEDALSTYDDWHGAVRCLARRPEDPQGCESYLSDISFRAAEFGSGYSFAGDADFGKYSGAQDRAAEARQLAAAAAKRMSPDAMKARQSLVDRETPASILGKQGKAGIAEFRGENAWPSYAEFGYAIEGSRAWSVIPNQWGGESIVATCDAARAFACDLTAKFEDGSGTYTLATNGAWSDATICFRIDTIPAVGTVRSVETTAVLDRSGCVPAPQRRALVRAVFNSGDITVVTGPGETERTVRNYDIQSFDFAFRVARFSTERIRN